MTCYVDIAVRHLMSSVCQGFLRLDGRRNRRYVVVKGGKLCLYNTVSVRASLATEISRTYTSFLMPKIWAKLQRGHPQRGAQ